jgi:uncharacterized protein YdiU (UPF0061 family)
VDAVPHALAYAGDQFGQFVPQLGDGRALMLGEVKDRHGIRQDVQLKGSGRTPYSRRGDGRAGLGPVLREYLLAEAMQALGVPTTRALAVVATGEPVFRERPLPGAVLTRVAASHVRVGSIQYCAARRDWAGVQAWVDYTLRRHYPEQQETGAPALALLQAVAERQALLIARWLQVGFIHGVMNTDNMALSGQTIDYGPCAFMDGYDPATVFSSIDHWGRYAFGKQPAMAAWNLLRLAEALLPVLEAERAGEGRKGAEAVLAAFPERLQAHWLAGMRHKLGLLQPEEGDHERIAALLQIMDDGRADYTLTFRLLTAPLQEGERGVAQWCSGFDNAEAAQQWLQGWLARIRREGGSDQQRIEAMHRVNPLYIPRNDRVEKALTAVLEDGDWQPYRQLYQVLQNPFQEQAGMQAYSAPPPPSWGDYQTFCGT